MLSHLDSILPLREVDLLLPLLLRHPGRLVLVESPADGTGLLGAEVERDILLVLVEDTELLPLLGVEDGEGAGDRLADVGATALSASRFFLPQLPSISTYILVSLAELPPWIFWTRRFTSSDLSSSSCLVRSSLFFVHNCAALTPG